jgi:hypothetical protein
MCAAAAWIFYGYSAANTHLTEAAQTDQRSSSCIFLHAFHASVLPGSVFIIYQKQHIINLFSERIMEITLNNLQKQPIG